MVAWGSGRARSANPHPDTAPAPSLGLWVPCGVAAMWLLPWVHVGGTEREQTALLLSRIRSAAASPAAAEPRAAATCTFSAKAGGPSSAALCDTLAQAAPPRPPRFPDPDLLTLSPHVQRMDPATQGSQMGNPRPAGASPTCSRMSPCGLLAPTPQLFRSAGGHSGQLLPRCMALAHGCSA